MSDKMEELLKELAEKTGKMTPEEIEELYGYKPDEYHTAAIEFQKHLDNKSELSDITGFAFPQAMTYLIGGMFVEPLKNVKEIALKLLDGGYNTFETEYDYNCADQYAHAFMKEDTLYFVKRSQSSSYVVIFEKDSTYEVGKIHIRSYWEEMPEYYHSEILELQKKISTDSINLEVLNQISGIVGLFSDSSYKKDFSNRPNLENVIGEVGMRYKDGRDTGYMATFKTDYNNGYTIEKGYSINQLTYTMMDMQSILED